MTDGSRVKINAPAAEGVVGNLTEFGNDVMTLAELQAKLAAIDLRDGVARAVLPAGIVAVSLALMLSASTVLLAGIGMLVATALHLDAGWGLLFAGLIGLVLGGAGAMLAAGRLPGSFENLRRSHEEFTRNLSWIRTVLVYSGRARPRSGK